MYGQSQAETGTAAAWQQLYLAAVVVGDAAHDGQPQPGAAGASVPALIQAHEGLEDLRGQRGIDAGAIVGHLQQIVVPLSRYAEACLAGGMAQGVADEVFQRPVQQSGVAAPGQSHGRAHEVELLVRSQGLPVGQGSALVAEEQGLADIRLIVTQAPAHLVPGGWLLLEHGWDQGEAVRQLLLQQGYVQVETVRDYGDNERVTLGRLAQ